MKEVISIVKEIEEEQVPEIGLSVTNLEINVEEGRVYRSSFTVESENNIPMKGAIYSTSDKMETEICEFEGLKVEIPYYFKGKLSSVDSEFEGDFVLITNGGEYNIPYSVRVIRKAVGTSIGKISNMTDFARLYAANRREAVELFFLPNFEEVFLRESPEERAVYHSLMKSRSRNLILEEFLTATGYKEVASLSLERKSLVLDVGKDRDTITLIMENGGYIEGKVTCDKDQVQLSCIHFTSDDFVDGKLEISIEKNKNYLMGSDVIHITTVRQSFEIPVEWWGTLPEFTREREKNLRLKKEKAELIHNYLYFRTGSIGFDDFAETGNHILDDLYLTTENYQWKFYKLHFCLMENQKEAAGQILAQLEEEEKKNRFSELEKHYFLYLKALFYRTPESISRAVVAIREFYGTSAHKAEALWMLIYLDREYVYNKRLQYDTIRQLFEQGYNSCLLYFEACDILNDNPSFMEELSSFETSIFRWGVRYGYVSMSLSYQFARLALKLKYYNKAVFHIACKLYEVEPDDLFLQVICSLLIKGNRVGKEYHRYFRRAVEANLKIIGLNEFFIRSMDFERYDTIPQRVLIYFTYSNSLDYMERAYLYTNVLKHEAEYDEVFGAYYSKMLPFVEEQLLQGRINEHLAYLYTRFQKEILSNPDNWKAVCDILFFRKLTCHNPRMIGVYVVSPETGEEKYYAFSGGVTQVEYYNSRTGLYFVDGNEQRYVKGIKHTFLPFLELSQFPENWVRQNLVNKKVLLVQSGKIDGPITEEDTEILKKIVFNADYVSWMQVRALEKLLVYYENHQNKAELARWLEKVDYSHISEGFQKTLMDYYMEIGMTENTFFGIELYGCSIMGAAKRLKLAVFGIQYYKGEMDETTLSLAWSAFIRKKYNKDTLTYLMDHFCGETEDLLLIWERSRKFELETTDFEKKILKQCMFTGNESDDVLPVFEAFYESKTDPETAWAYMDYIYGKDRRGKESLPDKIHRMIGREIVAGNVKGDEAGLHFLYHFAAKNDWHARVREAAVYIIEDFLERGIYLPVYHSYQQWFRFPVEYEELTFLTYTGESGRHMVLHYQIEGEDDSYTEKQLSEILPGRYVCSMNFFRKDHVNYRLESDGILVEDRTNILFETFQYDEKESRFFALNMLDDKESSLEEYEDYLRKACFVDEYLTLL